MAGFVAGVEVAVEARFVAAVEIAVESGLEAVFEADLGDDVGAIDAEGNGAGVASRGVKLGVAARGVASCAVGDGLGDIGGAIDANGQGAGVSSLGVELDVVARGVAARGVAARGVAAHGVAARGSASCGVGAGMGDVREAFDGDGNGAGLSTYQKRKCKKTFNYDWFSDCRNRYCHRTCGRALLQSAVVADLLVVQVLEGEVNEFPIKRLIWDQSQLQLACIKMM